MEHVVAIVAGRGKANARVGRMMRIATLPSITTNLCGKQNYGLFFSHGISKYNINGQLTRLL